MKTCISTYSYWRMYANHGWTLFDAIDKTKELGAEGVEFVLDDNPPDGLSLSEYAIKLTEYAHARGLETPIYTTGADFLNPDIRGEIERVKKHVDAASAAGINLMRHDITFGFPESYKGIRTFEAILPIIAPAIREVAEYAQSKGVTTCSENHGRLVQDSFKLNALFTAVNHPNYKYLCDIGNFDDADEGCAVAVSKLLPFIVHVHAKDSFYRMGMGLNPGYGWYRSKSGCYKRATIYGQGDNPTSQCLSIIYNSGYRGFVSLEFEGIEDTLIAIEAGHNNLKRDIELIKKGIV